VLAGPAGCGLLSVTSGGCHGRGDLAAGQGEVPWVVLADPEGNEFCVLSPR
jgi:hypothetical protein